MSQYEMNEEDKLYDEFGNYIGPDLSDADSDESSSDGSEQSDWDEFAAHDVSPRSPRSQQRQQQQQQQRPHSITPTTEMTASHDMQPNDEDDDDEDVDLTAANIQSEFEHSKRNTMQLISAQDAMDEDANTRSRQNAENNAIILHEDKEYYRSAQDTYGEDVEIQIQEEDTQPLETPIIAPIKEKCFELIERKLPRTTFNWKFLAGLMDLPSLIRNIAFIGHLHHGKTSFMDMLIKETHIDVANKYHHNKNHNKRHKHSNDAMLRYTDTRKDEQHRGLSIKAVPISLVLPDLRDKSWLINCLDVPGHVNFSDEMTASLRLVDGAVIVVDCCEGVLLNTQRAIKHALDDEIPIVLVLNKLDRLIIELRLPPKDAYLKLCHTLTEVNDIIKQYAPKNKAESLLLHPIKGNVCFASSWFSWSFTLQSFAKIYSDYHGSFDYKDFAKKLWGDIYYDAEQQTFVHGKENHQHKSKTKKKSKKRAFIQFILEPLYKIYAHTLGSDAQKLFPLFEELGIKLKKKELELDPKPLLSVILSRFFGESKGFVSMIVQHIPSPKDGNAVKIRKHYCGDLTSLLAENMLNCVSNTEVAMVNVTKMYPRPCNAASSSSSEFDAFGRVFCGTVRVGDEIKILREGYSPDDNKEDMSVMKIENIWIYQGRYRVEINQVRAGNWALFGGIDSGINKTATITHMGAPADTHRFSALSFKTVSVCKVAIEPIKPSELPKMTHGLRCINKSYPLCISKVEESGEHIICGTGELYLDCMLHDLRVMYSEIEIKVSDPLVSFCESVQETSCMKCHIDSKNGKNRLTMICEPLQEEIANDIVNGRVSIDWTRKQLGEYFETHYGWDLLAARNIWAFGPEKNGANILIDDTLPSADSAHKAKINEIRNSIVQGFEWATREGPLCDEPIRNCVFKLVDVKLSDNALEYGQGQIIPAARRCIYSSFMLATPALMEPMVFAEILSPPDCGKAIHDVVQHRRGRVLSESRKAGTPFICLCAELPAIDSFGFETDLRSHTQGQAFCLQVFSRWQIVPGQPMDDTITLMPLEPQPPHKLAREFMLKTRKRKGLADNVTYFKYFDAEMMKHYSALYAQ
eukprot:CAMPEP_0197032570 /NCGR_PEP_ID=MMETSP1384-20130603/11221_1 /TAXON_ID=29189 /ORGANISM="Ammonia sp." /LENGTH=1087 /DNA_ID=CAMNT_0042462255 /DNA_START=27 /DNA_END=3290 /DNA_ORIENTATION=-